MSMKIDLKNRPPMSPADALNAMLGGDSSATEPVRLPINRLTPFPDPYDTFRPYRDDKLQDLAESIRQNGILEPIIVRPYEKPDGTCYEILAGHNRTNAAKLAGLEKVPCIIKVISDAEAQRIFVSTNLNQRDELLPSEKAYAYKLLVESEEPCQVGTVQIAAEKSGESKRQMYRYIRLTMLIKDILNMVDDEKISFLAGVNISYLNREAQNKLLDFLEANEVKLTLLASEEIKDSCKDGEITDTQLNEIFMKPRKPIEKRSLKLPLKEIGSYLKSADDDSMVREIVKIVKEYYLKK